MVSLTPRMKTSTRARALEGAAPGAGVVSMGVRAPIQGAAAEEVSIIMRLPIRMIMATRKRYTILPGVSASRASAEAPATKATARLTSRRTSKRSTRPFTKEGVVVVATWVPLHMGIIINNLDPINRLLAFKSSEEKAVVTQMRPPEEAQTTSQTDMALQDNQISGLTTKGHWFQEGGAEAEAPLSKLSMTQIRISMLRSDIV
jgi:hypothetical protein